MIWTYIFLYFSLVRNVIVESVMPLTSIERTGEREPFKFSTPGNSLKTAE